MLEFKVASAVATTIYQAVRAGGSSAWRQSAQAKAKGEKRILKLLPDDPRIAWTEWKAKPGVFD